MEKLVEERTSNLRNEIDQRTLIERKLREDEMKIRLLFETLPQRIFYKNNDSVYVSCNRLFAKDLGLSPDQITGKTDYDLFPSHLAKKYRADDDLVRRTNESHSFEEEYCLGHKKFIVQTTKTPVHDDRGELNGVLGIFEDITERKQTENEIRKLSQAVQQSPVSIVITDVNGVIEYVNPKFSEISGYAFEEAVKKKPSILKSGYQSREFYKGLWDSIISGQEWKGELLNKRKNGDLYWESALIFPVRDETGSITHFIGIKEDITRQKKLQERLQAAASEIQASDKAAVLGKLAAGVTHEILNPLNIISLHVQMLLRDKSQSPELQEKIVKIKNEVARIDKICRQLLLFSRKKTTPTAQAVQINCEIESALVLLEKDFYLENIRVAKELKNDLPTVNIDVDEMRQVFLNLLLNAKYAMRAGGGVLTIQTESLVHADRLFVRVRISDTGSGIAKEHLEHIFEPFFTTKPEGEGTGMGLSVVRGIIDKHGGTIEVESEEGKGTDFAIFLPATI